MAVTHATIVATVALDSQTAEHVARTVRAVLEATLGLDLVGCDWAPDLDTIADATGVDYDNIVLLDLNPARSEG